jgi:anti-sigma-K factor RskA
MNLLEPARLDALAREHALGLLVGGARRRFERLLREQAPARQAVAAWQERLAVLATGVPEPAPRPEVWAGLQQRLFGPAVAAAPRARWRRWLPLPALTSALAGLLLGAVLLRLQPGWLGLEPGIDGLPASYVGLLVDSAGRPALLASSRRHGRVLAVKLLAPLAVPAGWQAQLWALPRDGSAALPVATLPLAATRPGATVSVELPAASEALFFKVDRLAVSLEPSLAVPGGLPGTPTQPFVASGHCVKLW